MQKNPSFYDSRRIGTLFHPDTAEISRSAAQAGLQDSSSDTFRIQLLLIDMQIDFCHTRGARYVPGALGDIWRSIEFIYRHAARITAITCSLDSHVPSGGVGHALDPELWSAVFWHALARKSQPTWWAKGIEPGMDHHSVIRPEGDPPRGGDGAQAQRFMSMLGNYDVTIIAGEAESRCVLETAEALAEELADRPDLLKRVFILKDCMSPVEHPDLDLHAILEVPEALRQ